MCLVQRQTGAAKWPNLSLSPPACCLLSKTPGKAPVDKVLHLVVAETSPPEWMWRLGVLNILPDR